MGRERLARYSLAGPENQAAVDAGLAGGTWFRSAVPRKRMKELMRRSDYPAVRDTANLIGLLDVPMAFWLMGRHATGRLTAEEADYVPEPERRKVYRTARIHLAIYGVTVASALAFRTWLPVVLIGGPRAYGACLFYF